MTSPCHSHEISCPNDSAKTPVLDEGNRRLPRPRHAASTAATYHKLMLTSRVQGSQVRLEVPKPRSSTSSRQHLRIQGPTIFDRRILPLTAIIPAPNAIMRTLSASRHAITPSASAPHLLIAPQCPCLARQITHTRYRIPVRSAINKKLKERKKLRS